MYRAHIFVQGIVQGVGFRPTVYRLANDFELKGYVRNLGNIVEIVVEGEKETIRRFISDLKSKRPPISKISNIEVGWDEINHFSFTSFEIRGSSSKFKGTSVIPADVATCEACLSDMNNPKDRRYLYPFTACTDCGPRFTVIEKIPYDRERTSMRDFPLCEECQKEYENPADRRYHAEATCCPICGPKLSLYDDEPIHVDDPLKEASKILDEGYIVAIKGIGGTHLACDATNEETVKRLRDRLGRPYQPFACMSPDIETIKSFAIVSAEEEKVLMSRRRPIVILKKSDGYDLAPSVAPGLHNIGIMLPYSGIHHMLFKYARRPAYVMTSANKPGEPMIIKNKEILRKLKGVADYFLIHNRRIVNRCDDSVVRFRGNEMAFIRRSRGYTPEPYDLSSLSSDSNIVALGPEIDVTFAVLNHGECYLSQYIGNTTKYETTRFLEDALKYLMRITGTEEVDAVACDLHPRFFTTRLAEELSREYSAPLFKVQHHHAHATALAVDYGVDELVCIAADGVGYGDDGTAWGGEILYCFDDQYKRLGSLAPQKMPGGDLCTIYPARMLFSILGGYYALDYLEELFKEEYGEYFPHGEKEIELVRRQLERDINVGITTSTGRILDSVATALHICSRRTYEGECAMKLESAAYKSSNSLDIPYRIDKYKGRYVLDTTDLLLKVMELKNAGERIVDIAAAAQRSLSMGLAEMAVRAAEDVGTDIIGGSGGVFYNEAISLTIKDYVEEMGYRFIQHKSSCAGDGSVSLGQAVIASRRL
ncbi:MAG TPA: carbamoyltransferase HypF [Methanothermobacter sp.]|jgi:hydrogenase maturation protein HypF|uniref:Carbamoyltransferase n=1 Tax=Methanothermobacter tenebrarum TaxID=680118 RepID=A0ABM7YC36_9EURY|nr:carbamoyltransferase HypF [Methanothermobacter tenebrarum]MDD3454110.1 carbamoyltransferase HypF [Methanobacteriales archaeon]MDX9693235.1 carbamoyltransferase HypF [Methanothermobacter sp.]BDH78776.1 carbamoyltransferase HypF [Methanothermobacter tenebrarum]HHW16994.1 carbamoyltransferase HypF [Methanothermobacter sp.]HOQ20701.1 carbamoyltransferase HypF [Methanothermobacter sp.]